MTTHPSPRSGITPKAVAGYTAMVLGGVGAFLLVRGYGERLTAPAPAAAMSGGAAAVSAAANTPNVLVHVLLALAAVIIAGRLCNKLLGVMGQPAVIGELVAGIALGPSILGRFAPHIEAYVLPAAVAPYLGLVAQLGVLLYMFLVGLELNGDLLEERAHSMVMVSHASIVAPFVLGSVLALYLYPRLSTSDVSFTSFALFLGVAMSITAFPVLARILTDRGLSRTRLGAVSLTAAAADDVTAWCLLAVVVGITKGTLEGAAWSIVLTAGFVALMFLVVRPLVTHFATRSGDRAPGTEILALTLAGVLLASLTTEWTGVHAIFGAFAFGAVIPHDSALARTLIERLHVPVSLLLLPAFFAFTGMRTEIGLVSGPALWLTCALIIAVATIGKFGGTLAAARLTGMDWQQSTSLGILMNTRGLMEIIVLTVGLDLGVISPTLFTMMVLMALATTAMTSPALALVGEDAFDDRVLRYTAGSVSARAAGRRGL